MLDIMTNSPILKTFLWFPGNMEDALKFYVAELGATIQAENRTDGDLFMSGFTHPNENLFGE